MLTRRQILAGGAVMAAGVVLPGAGAAQPRTCRVWTGRCWTPVVTDSLKQGDLVQLAGQYPVIVTSEGWVRDPTTGAFVLMRHHYGRFVQDMYRGVTTVPGLHLYIQPGRERGHYNECHVGGLNRREYDGTYRYWLNLVTVDYVIAQDDTGIIDVPYTVKVA